MLLLISIWDDSLPKFKEMKELLASTEHLTGKDAYTQKKTAIRENAWIYLQMASP